MKARLIEEHPAHYILHDGKAPFRVPKAGLSEAMHAKIRAMGAPGMANGGEAKPHIQGRIISEKSTFAPPEKPHIQGRIISETTTYPEPEKPHVRGKILSETTSREGDRPEHDPRELEQMSVQRYRGGEIPARGYADGGGVDEPMMRDAGPSVASIPMGTAGGMPGPVDMNPAVYVPPQPMVSAPSPSQIPGTPEFAQLQAMMNAPPAPGSMASYKGEQNKAAGAELDKRKMAEQAKEALVHGVDAGAAPPPAPPPAAKPGGIDGGLGVRLPGLPKDDAAARGDLLRRQQENIAQRGAVESQEAEQKATEAAAQVRAVADAAQQEKAIRDRAASATDAAMADVNSARAEMARIDSSVDPGRYWASRSTGGKIAGILGLVLGSVGAGADGVNRAAGMLNQAIDRDLEAQKAEYEARMRKGGARLAGAERAYDMVRNRIGDELAANHAAKASALELSIAKLKQIEASTQSPMAKLNAQQLGLALEQQKQGEDAKAKQVLFNNGVEVAKLGQGNQQLRLEGAKVAAAQAGAGGLDQKQRDELLGVETYHRDIQRAGQKLKDLIKAYGTAELTGPAEAMMRQAVTDMATASAKLNDPGSVARASEVEQEAKNIFQPGFAQTVDGALGAIDSYMQNAAAKRDTHLRVRGIRP